jgi:hypothetical protein
MPPLFPMPARNRGDQLEPVGDADDSSRSDHFAGGFRALPYAASLHWRFSSSIPRRCDPARTGAGAGRRSRRSPSPRARSIRRSGNPGAGAARRSARTPRSDAAGSARGSRSSPSCQTRTSCDCRPVGYSRGRTGCTCARSCSRRRPPSSLSGARRESTRPSPANTGPSGISGRDHQPSHSTLSRSDTALAGPLQRDDADSRFRQAV